MRENKAERFYLQSRNLNLRKPLHCEWDMAIGIKYSLCSGYARLLRVLACTGFGGLL